MRTNKSNLQARSLSSSLFGSDDDVQVKPKSLKTLRKELDASYGYGVKTVETIKGFNPKEYREDYQVSEEQIERESMDDLFELISNEY